MSGKPEATPACPQCGGATSHPFSIGGVCLRCAAERALLGEDFSLPPPVEHPGPLQPDTLERIGVYAIIDEIGRGGMACVYAARQAGLGRIVALKALPEGRGGVAGLELRFLREAQTAARLRHPHIVGVHDFGRADGQVYFTMDYIDGGDLAHRLRTHPYTPREAAVLLQKVAGALAYTHGEGVLHRDLKPSNILLDGDEPRLADFGLAAQLEPGGDLTAITGVLGTPHYVAPEALRDGSGALTAASDIYALGVILYE
ncbi:MAG: serine/threonine-protein kinase, partial [Opitutales bacterium]